MVEELRRKNKKKLAWRYGCEKCRSVRFAKSQTKAKIMPLLQL